MAVLNPLDPLQVSKASVFSRVIILDDDQQYLNLLQTISENEGMETCAYSDPRLFLQHSFNRQDLIILDLSLPVMDGIEVLRILAGHKLKVKIILISGQDRSVLKAAEDLAKAQSLNHVATLSKPVKIAQLRALLRNVFEQPQNNEPTATAQAWILDPGELEMAIYNDEITPYYQPQINLSNHQLYGLEALARWHHPQQGLIAAAAFIPTVEKMGLIGPLTDRLLKKSIADMNQLSAVGLNNIHLSVNFNAANINNYTLPETLMAVATENQIKPDLFTLEVTESGLMSELVKSLDILARLRMKGFNLSIDDFGTGYSSFYLLHKMPFNELKIDQSFVRTMQNDPDSFAIVESCIMLANKLGMSTVAEGIEDQQTYQALQRLGCTYGQGYFMARPMPLCQLHHWHKKWSLDH